MLEVVDVSKRYGSINALANVSLRADSGEVVALVGENGAGKSTLVRCVARAVLPDTGTVSIDGALLGRSPREAISSGLSVVWQDLALCENLDVTANLFLGRELGNRGALRTAAMRSRAASVFENLNVTVPELNRPIERLSGGQRQLVAIARATLDEPKVLVLDEPTAALGIAESRTVLDVVRTLQQRGVCVLLVSHQLDEVFDVADRIAVIRHGQVVADLHRAETHPDDVVAMITGADVDSTAGQQLKRLHSLAEQLADADQSSVLPMTVSSLSGALSTERLALLMIEESGGPREFRRSAVLNLPSALEDELGTLDLQNDNFVGEAALDESLLVVPQLRDRLDDPLASTAATAGLGGAWAAPIMGQQGALAVIVGFTDTVTQLQPDQVQLLELFSSMAGVAVERGRLVETLGGRNRALEGLRGVLENLAGPALAREGMAPALDALCTGVGSEAAVLAEFDATTGWKQRAVSSKPIDDAALAQIRSAFAAADDAVEVAGDATDSEIVIAPFDWSRGKAALLCRWSNDAPDDAREVIDGAANSFRLAMERELKFEAEQEAAALQRSRELERGLTRRIGHELRTPLTAIQGYASTMLQPDVDWPDVEQKRFLGVIEAEAGRLGRLVAQMFDESSLESGLLRLYPDYYDLVAVISQASGVVAASGSVDLSLPVRCEIWGDSDRLEQVFINLIGNALRHNPEGTKVEVRMVEPAPDDRSVVVEVSDNGQGMPKDALDYVTGVGVRDRDRGLGLRLVRGLVAAHGGNIEAESRQGEDGGTTVRVHLPIDRPDAVNPDTDDSEGSVTT